MEVWELELYFLPIRRRIEKKKKKKKKVKMIDPLSVIFCEPF